MISRFFIDRPIFAAVLSIVITLLGAVALWRLPITQYPRITPPTIRVNTYYPGASAEVLAESVAAPIEQEVNGVEDMLYMSSQCTNDGNYALSVTFKPGVDLNMAQVLVQNRVSLALPALPDVVKAAGVTTRKRNPDILLLVSIFSPQGRYNQLYLNNYANIHIKEVLARVDGVADISLFSGQDYSMRIWVDPEKLAVRGVTAGDVVQAVRQQNTQVAAGQIGSPPAGKGQQLQRPLATRGRLSDAEQFNDIVIRSTPDGRLLRIRDVGFAELGGKNQDIVSYLDGKPCANVAVFQLPDANALDTAKRVRDKMEELKQSFPEGIAYDIVYDTSPFVRDSIVEVFITLGYAVALVALVVLLFLQNWRASVIPLVAVPVAIVGTFAAMAAFGFSINMLTLFGLVLAIGIVVDDAIVVVEAVGHHIEQGMAPRAATCKAMEEVSGPVVAVGLVLAAVFVPCAFISGITGQFFRQFALTIAVSTVISAFNSLTLSPALCAILLKPHVKGRRDEILPRWGVALALGVLAAWLLPPHLIAWAGPLWGRAETAVGPITAPWVVRGVVFVVCSLVGWPISWLVNLALALFFQLFNLSFHAVTGGYTWVVGWALRGSLLVLVAYAGLVYLTYYRFQQLPLGYIPNQDQGKAYVSVQMPDAASLERTKLVVKKIDAIVRSTPGVAHTISTAGQSFTLNAYGSNFGQFFVTLDDFHRRTTPDLTSGAIIANLRRRIEQEIPDGNVAILGPPPVTGLGSSGGFKIMIEDRRDLGTKDLQDATDKLIARANELPQLARVFTISRANSPQVLVDVNREQSAARGLALNDVFTTLQVYMGSTYVNDFNRFDRTWQVNVQALGKYRNSVDAIRRLKVRNQKGDMVPLGAVTTAREINGPLVLTRYNMYPAITVNGSPRPGVSSAEAIAAMAQLAQHDLPAGMSFEWTEITYLQLQAGNTAMLVFALAVVGVFLVLSALYESWALPLAIILVVPMCLLGSITGVALSGPGADINIFTQVGFVVLVGLASKNAILIVEFAKLKREAGLPRREATLAACQLRLRPILMTSFAFILGVLPLMLSTGAGAEMRRILGTAVFSGMVGVTIFGIFLTPVFFYVIDLVGEASVFGSRRVRFWLALGFGLLGLGALAAVELLLVASWRNGVLSLEGLIALSAAVLGVLALLTVRQWLRGGRVRTTANLVKALWYRRQRTRAATTAVRAQPPTKDGNGAARTHAIQVLPPTPGPGDLSSRDGE